MAKKGRLDYPEKIELSTGLAGLAFDSWVEISSYMQDSHNSEFERGKTYDQATKQFSALLVNYAKDGEINSEVGSTLIELYKIESNQETFDCWLMDFAWRLRNYKRLKPPIQNELGSLCNSLSSAVYKKAHNGSGSWRAKRMSSVKKDKPKKNSLDYTI